MFNISSCKHNSLMFSLDILQHSKSIIQWSVSCHLSESSKLNHCLFLLIFWGNWAEDWSEDCEDWAWLALDWFWRGLTASAQEKIISTRNINYKKLIGPWKTNILIITNQKFEGTLSSIWVLVSPKALSLYCHQFKLSKMSNGDPTQWGIWHGKYKIFW